MYYNNWLSSYKFLFYETYYSYFEKANVSWKCAVNFCQNNTVMLTYRHNHSLGIWQCFCHRNEKQNSEPFFNYHANLISVIYYGSRVYFFFFAMLVSLYYVIICDVINVKDFCEILRYFFQVLATPLQLPPVEGIPVYNSATSIKGFIALDLWRKFQLVELTEVVLQRAGFEFIILLIKLEKEKLMTMSVKWTQFPLALLWACTFHKVQGLCLTEFVVSFDLEKQVF